MSEAETAGGECDAYCTKCKRDALHNIVAMDATGKTPAQVQCRSCQGTHKYRAPKSAPAVTKKAAAPKAKSTSKKALAAKTPAAPSPAALYKRWEDLVGKKAGVTAHRYKVDAAYGADDVIEHKQFGLGFVTEEVNWNRIKVLFQATRPNDYYALIKVLGKPDKTVHISVVMACLVCFEQQPGLRNHIMDGHDLVLSLRLSSIGRACVGS